MYLKMRDTKITKETAITTLFYSVFLISRFTEKQFINYCLKNWTDIKDEMDLLEYSRLLEEVIEEKEKIREDIYAYYKK